MISHLSNKGHPPAFWRTSKKAYTASITVKHEEHLEDLGMEGISCH